MKPVITHGSSVCIKEKDRYLPGDIIAFYESDTGIKVHRVLGFYPSRSGTRYLCKGDHSLYPDRGVDIIRILGEVIGSNNSRFVRPGLTTRVRCCLDFARICVAIQFRKLSRLMMRHPRAL